MKNKASFIGPLGDDIPSIFPIVTGILLFMSSIAFLSSNIAEKNNLIELRKTGISTSDIILQSGYMSNPNFDVICSEAKKYVQDKGYNLFISFQKGCNKGIEITRGFNEIRKSESNDERDCACWTEQETQPCTAPTSMQEPDYKLIPDKTSKGIFLTYPIAGDCSGNGIGDESLKGPAKISIAVYNK